LHHYLITSYTAEKAICASLLHYLFS